MNLAARLLPYQAMSFTGKALSRGLSSNLTDFGAAMKFELYSGRGGARP